MRMMIPIRAVFNRSQTRGGRATLAEVQCADVPDALLMGTMAQTAADIAIHAHDEENFIRIRRAIDAACEDGKLMTMD